MSSDTGSAILTALYNRNPDEARRLADARPTLTVWEAAALGRDDDLARLLEADRSLANTFAPDGFTPLTLAAFFASASTLHRLLDAGADCTLAARNQMRVQPLHAAVASRNREAIELLLERGADPNATQQVGYTPLMGAAGSGRDDLVDLLLARGADPAAVAEDGKTAERVARDHGRRVLAERLAGLAARRA